MKKHHAIFFNAQPGWLCQPLPDKFDHVGGAAEVKHFFRAFADELGQYTDPEFLIGEVWVGEFESAQGVEGLEPDYRLALGPRGGIVKYKF